MRSVIPLYYREAGRACLDLRRNTMKISILTMSGGPTDVEGHRAGCADIARKVNARKCDQPWTEDWPSKRAAFLDYNCDFIAEADGDESNSWTITWLPCADALPETHVATYAEQLAKIESAR
jgi:hypothetical protein